MNETYQLSISLATLVYILGGGAVGWFLGAWWKSHAMGQKTLAEKLQELANNSRAADRLGDLSPELKAWVADYINKNYPTPPKA